MDVNNFASFPVAFDNIVFDNNPNLGEGGGLLGLRMMGGRLRVGD